MAPSTDCGYDQYWKLDPYHKSTRTDLLEQLESKGITFTNSITRAELIEVLHRQERGILHYEDARITDKELSRFIKDRRLPPPISESRKAAITVLKGADEGQTFNRFTDLPPELRERVYGFYVGAFPELLQFPVQPPLARTCKLIRHEVLPIFYNTPTFQLNFYYPRNIVPEDAIMTRRTLRPCPDTTAFLYHLSAQPRRQIGSVEIVVSAASTEEIRTGKMQPLLRFSVQTMPKAGAIWKRTRPLSKKPAKYESLKENVKEELGHPCWAHFDSRLAELFTVDDIYELRGALERVFFETYTKNGEWN